MSDFLTEHYATEREAKDRYRRIAGRMEIPFRGKILNLTYYLENTEAPLCWCVKYTIQERATR